MRPICAPASAAASTTPRPVADSRPSDPPNSIGLPVTTPGTMWPTLAEYWSSTHAITCEFVPTSGAGTSLSGPRNGISSETYRRVMRSSSPSDKLFGSIAIPPLAPPSGKFIIAVLSDIPIASATTSSRVTPGWYRIPPFAGPRVVLWCTRQPTR